MSRAGPPADDAFVYRVGRLLKAHALRGDVVVQRFRALPITVDDLKGRRVKGEAPILLERDDWPRGRWTRLRHIRWLDPTRAVVHLDGIDDRDAAEAVQGAFVDLDPARLPAELTDEVDAVFGAQAVDADTGAPLGEITDIRDNGAQAILEIGDEPGILVPWVEAFIAGVDAGPPKTVKIRPIPGLLEANDPHA